jgi:hypothetical protein
MLSSENHFTILVTLTLTLRGPENKPSRGLHITLLNTKFDYNMSFLTLVIVWKKILFLVTVTLTLTPGGGVQMQYQPRSSYNLANKYQV